MPQLILRKPNGDELNLIGVDPLRGVASGEQRMSLLTQDTLDLTLTSTDPVDFPLGSTLAIFEQLYTLNLPPVITKTGDKRYKYELTLEGPQYQMLRSVFFDTTVVGTALSSTFTLTGNLAFFAQVLLVNIIRLTSGAWDLGLVQVPSPDTLGAVIEGADTEIKTLSFENENCLGVLQRLCQEWGTEFYIEYRPNDAPNRILHIVPLGNMSATAPTGTYTYGEGKGLYTLERKNLAQVVYSNKLYVYGSIRNIPTWYRDGSPNQRLQLPLTGSNPQGPFSPWDSVVQDAASIARDGVFESTKIFDDIYPSRTGTVTASTSQLTFTDVDIEFNPFEQKKNVYKYLLSGIPMKVHFQTGQLAGYEFEVTLFEPATAKFTLKPYTNETGQVFPTDKADQPFKIAAGDTYVLIDLSLPETYVEAAEAKLLAAAQTYLAENLTQPVEYDLTIDELYLKETDAKNGHSADSPSTFFRIGDTLRVIDEPLGIDVNVRVTALTRDPLRPYKYTLTVGDVRRISQLKKVLARQFRATKQSSSTNDLPANVATVPQVKSMIGPFAGTAKFELFAALFPNGYTTLVTHVKPRDEAVIDIVKKDLKNGTIELPVGRIKATGRKYPF